MKTFKYSYGKVVFVLLIICLPVAAASVVFNLLRVINEDNAVSLQIALILIIALSAAAFILILAAVFWSRYKITENKIITGYGLINSKINIKDVEKLTEFKKSKKLVMYLKNGKFYVVCIRELLYDEFCSCLRFAGHIKFEIDYEEN